MKYLLLPLLLLTSCSEPQPTFIDFVNTSIILRFYADYNEEEYTLLTFNTVETYDKYYITDCYYIVEFDNNVYETTYISAVNDKQELITKEIK